MKMIILLVKDHLTEMLTGALTGAQYRVTRIASTGGFLRSGTATMLIGVEDAQVEAAITLIRSAVGATPEDGPQVKLFVVPVSRFEQLPERRQPVRRLDRGQQDRPVARDTRGPQDRL